MIIKVISVNNISNLVSCCKAANEHDYRTNNDNLHAIYEDNFKPIIGMSYSAIPTHEFVQIFKVIDITNRSNTRELLEGTKEECLKLFEKLQKDRTKKVIFKQENILATLYIYDQKPLNHWRKNGVGNKSIG